MEGCSAFNVTLLVTSEQSLCDVQAQTDKLKTDTHTHAQSAEIGAARGYKTLSLISYFPVVTVKLTFSVPAVPVNGSLR